MDYLSTITNNQIKDFETNYSNKQLLQHKINESDYQKELPAAILTLTPNNPSNNENLKFKRVGDGVNNEEIIIGDNKTKKQQIFTHIKFEQFSLQVRINCHDAFQTVSFMDAFTDVMPLHRWYYPFEYYDYVEVSRLTSKYEWDWLKDDVENIIEQVEKTSGKRLRFAKLHTEPLIRMNSVDHEVDYDQGRFSINANFDIRLPLPYSMMITNFREIKEIIPIVSVQSQRDENANLFREVDGINMYVDDSTRLSVMVNPKLLDCDNYTLKLTTDEANQIGLLNTPFPKTIIHLDSNNMVVDKFQLNMVMKKFKKVDDGVVFDLKDYSSDLDRYKMAKSNNQLIIVNTFEKDRYKENKEYVDNLK